MKPSLLIISTIVISTEAWAPTPKASTPIRSSVASSCEPPTAKFDPLQLSHAVDRHAVAPTINNAFPTAAFLAAALPIFLVGAPEAASAATAFTPNAVPTALVAYGHFVSLAGVVATLVAERLTIKPNMSPEEEDFLAAADIGYGIFGALIAYTGYLRAVQYEKGFDFYSHEPLFWLKIAFVGIWGASSFFNTATIIKRAVDKRNGKFVPMGEKLAKRMIQICNAELVAVAIIPLTATFMARGVAYSEDIPWEAEAALAALIFVGASYKYLKEAFSFEDDVPKLESSD
jgi:putative membrane protein